MIISYKVYA